MDQVASLIPRRANPSGLCIRRGCCGPVRSRLWRPDSRGHGARAWPLVGSIPRSSDSDSPSGNDGHGGCGNRAPVTRQEKGGINFRLAVTIATLVVGAGLVLSILLVFRPVVHTGF